MILVLLIVVATILRALDQIDQTTFVALVGPIGGYAVGNGIAAKNDQTVEPVFTSRSHPPHALPVDPYSDDQ